jgi:hypothetical protein
LLEVEDEYTCSAALEAREWEKKCVRMELVEEVFKAQNTVTLNSCFARLEDGISAPFSLKPKKATEQDEEINNDEEEEYRGLCRIKV